MNFKPGLCLLALLLGVLSQSVRAADVVFLTHKYVPVVSELSRRVGNTLALSTAVEVISSTGFKAKDARAIVVVGPQALAMWKPNKIQRLQFLSVGRR
jgi:hypothetical protein